MPKTDKELTAEIVISYVESWNARSGTTVLKTDDLIDLITAVYNTVHSLDDPD